MAKSSKISFTVIVPTYTGEEYLSRCFDSILYQKLHAKYGKFNVVVVIDGPNNKIREITRSYESKFQQRKIEFQVRQFSSNKGRFQARLEGARTAKAEQLLFVDDRVTFDKNYFSAVLGSGQRLMIPNVLEAEAKNKINRCLYLLRRIVYGKSKFGSSFESFFIDYENFEKSPKGTTSLWVSKKDFIAACNAINQNGTNNRYVNDDTKIFRYFIDCGQKIYKSSEAKIYYNPRSSSWQELEHIFERGPRFVDYYMRPGTRYFLPLMVLIVAVIAALVACVANPQLLAWIAGIMIVVNMLATVILSEKLDDMVLFFFYPVIAISFGLGVIKGLLGKL